MTKEQAKELLPIIQAFAEGKTIQFLIGGKWTDIYETDFYQSSDKYRIKPELEYRPFKNQEECWQEMLKHQPFGGIEHKDGSSIVHIGKVYIGKDNLLSFMWNCPMYMSLDQTEMFAEYTFIDGAPFGIKEQTNIE